MQQSQSDRYSESFDESKLKQLAQLFDQVLDHPKLLTTQQEILNEQLNNQKQKVIFMDCQRTRAKIFSPQLHEKMQKTLTNYCRIQRIDYKQGLNEILGPFIYFHTVGISLAKCQALFHTFFKRYGLALYEDQEFISLQLFFKFLSIVLKYHRPNLSRFLQCNDIEPQLYAISWIMTLFSSKLSLEMTYELWQFYAIQNDKFLIFFIIIAIVIYHRNHIIQSKNHSLLSILTRMMFRNKEELRKIIILALVLRKNTPSSLTLFLKEKGIFQKKQIQKNHTNMQKLLTNIESLNLFLVLNNEIVLQKHFRIGLCEQNCHFCDLKKPINSHRQLPCSQMLKQLIVLSSDIRTMDYHIDFTIIDIRKNKTQKIEYSDAIFKIDPFESIEEIQKQFLQKFMQTKGLIHFMFLLSQFTFEDDQVACKKELETSLKLIKMLISTGFPYLSILEGGFAAYKNIAYDIRSKILATNKKINKTKLILQQDKPQPILHQIKDPSQQILPLSSIFYIDEKYKKQQLVVFTGSKEIIFLTSQMLIFCQRNIQLEKLLIHLQANFPIVDFIYENPDRQIHTKFVYGTSLLMLAKISMKVSKPNNLVFYSQHCVNEQHRIEWQGNLIKSLKVAIIDVCKQYLKCKFCQKHKHKHKIQFETYQNAQQCSEIVGKYRNNLKKQINYLMKFQE